MKSRSAPGSQAKSAFLISDPTTSRQFGADGSLLFWRDAHGGAPRRGLLCVPRVCPSPECVAVHVWLGEVDASMSCVTKTDSAFAFTIDTNVAGAAARLPMSSAYANYDTGRVELSAAEGSESSPLVEWLIASADADVLGHLRAPLLRRELAAGRVPRPRRGDG